MRHTNKNKYVEKHGMAAWRGSSECEASKGIEEPE